MLTTPEKIQELRKKLYQKAKQEKEFRFYALYDKVYRKDIIEFAYSLVKSKKGAMQQKKDSPFLDSPLR